MAYTTKQSLLEAIRNNNEISWREFYETYRPLIFFCAAQANLSEEETRDLVQSVMLKVFKMKDVFVYDKTAGRFRDYLGKMVHNAIVDLRRAKQRHPEEVSLPEDSLGEDVFKKHWEDEWQNHVLEQALIQLQKTVHETTFQAFQLAALERRPVREVADFLQISVQNVYEAKSRCLEQLRKFVESLEEED
jgi:RNA polymerase sigma-70 factor (ECF subfamily)